MIFRINTFKPFSNSYIPLYRNCDKELKQNYNNRFALALLSLVVVLFEK